MPTDHRQKLASIKRFDQLIAYLRDEMGWPIARDSFEDVDDLFYDFTAEELGIEAATAAKITEIKRLKPLSTRQPWGIFFVKFEPKRLPVVALRRILSQVALKKRASANAPERAAWAKEDLLFISNYGEGDERQISFAHFSAPADGRDLPTLKVLGWDNRDTALRLDAVALELTQHLAWPADEADVDAWRSTWRGAFTLRHGEVVTTSKALSVRLAKLAGDIRDRIKSALAIETDTGPLTKLMKAFQTSLVHDLDASGFADMYAQTIAYGLLSARIADPHKKTVDDFAGHMRTNPFLRELMETFLKVGGRRGKAGGPGIDFDELGVSDVMQLLDGANMEAVVLDFGDKNPQEDPVIHFYELFLKEYDAKKRMQRGVFYTPRPVVSYIVRSVDEMLRTEFGLADGLADTTTWGEMANRHKDLEVPDGVSPDQDFVQILDPATGTGTFLVEVIDLIHKTLAAKWQAQGHGETKINALWNEYVAKHLLTRLHGYELLMAPYAITHLKLGLKLYETGYRFGSDERARVYLTNALEPAQDVSGRFEFAIPALAHEAHAVNNVKRLHRFTVVIGNPPYSGISSNMTDHAQRIVDAYKTVDGGALNERKLWLQDDYVKFIRKAQTLIDSTMVGVLGYITNHGYLDNPTFRGMRQSLMGTFPRLRVLDLHGNANKKEQAPDGSMDKPVFDIKQGVAICFATRGGADLGVAHAELWGSRESKYSWLASHRLSDTGFTPLAPDSPFYFFEPQNTDCRAEYDAGWKINDAMPVNCAGFISARDHFVIALDKSTLLSRIGDFANLENTDDAIRAKYFAGYGSAKYPNGDSRGWKIPEARRRVAGDKKWRERVRTCLYRPFDSRHIYWANWMVDWPRPEVMRHMFADGALALSTTRSVEIGSFEHVFCSRLPLGHHTVSLKEVNYLFPLYLLPDEDAQGSLALRSEREPNFSPAFLRAVSTSLKVAQKGPYGLPVGLMPEDIFQYAYAVFHSPRYRSRYAEFLRSDFPRLALTGNLRLFLALARLGGELTDLHLLESPRLATPMTEFVGRRDLEVGQASWSNHTVWIDKAQTAGFKGVRWDVWHFRIGGYQVCEKWLKDRKGRTLSKDDIAHYQKIVFALAETIRLMKEIDEVIEQHGGWPGAFQTGEAKAATAKVPPFRPRIVEPKPEERYVTCVPLVPLKAAAGAFGDPQHFEDGGFEWAVVESRHRLRPGIFVGQVVGKSMEPAIPDGAWCLFRAPVEGTRQGKTVLVQLRDEADSETGERYTVKRYESVKAGLGDSWTHERITLRPMNAAFAPLVLEAADSERLQVVAEFLEVVSSQATAPPEAEGTTEPEEWTPPFELRAPEHQPSLLDASPSRQPAAPEEEDSEADDRSKPEVDPDDLPCQTRALFSDGVSRERETAIRQLRERLGFSRTGHVLREMLDNAIRTAVRRGILTSEGGELALGMASVADFDREFLKEQFLASLGGRVWRDRGEATKGLARWLGFRRTGPVIEDAVRSVVNGLIREGRLEARKDEIRRAD
jgi:hypothetical protein